jgi:formate hydrogenlyase subunit 6/NADH:ubiquinone oxidoreductase subunit I
MLPTIIKNLFSRPATRRYPFRDVREPFTGTRGRVHFDMEKCNLCTACARVCPANAIIVDKENKTIKYDPFACIYCGNCVDSCPRKAITMDIFYSLPAVEKSQEQLSSLLKGED